MTGSSYLHSIERRPLGGVAAALLFGGFASLLRKLTAQLLDCHRNEPRGILWIDASFIGGF